MNEHEKLVAKCEAQEAEILRLNQAFDDLKKWMNESVDMCDGRNGSDYDDGVIEAYCSAVSWINRNTGIKK